MNKLFNKHTDKHKDHPVCIRRVIGNGVTHIGLYCQQCQRDNWITWLTKDEAKLYKKKFKIKQLEDKHV